MLFEKSRKWTGLLVEADPSNYATLKSKNRKAFSINACLNTEPFPAMVIVHTFCCLFYVFKIHSTRPSQLLSCQHRVKVTKYFVYNC